MFGNNNDQNQPGQPVQDIQAPVSAAIVPEPMADGSLASTDSTVVTPSTAPVAATVWPGADASPAAPSGGDELLNIKQQALQQLTPLVGHLDQTPEEKFRTTMMMIQASDDQSLLKDAYDTAKQISDDKARAQALLDIINEINYFTQQHSS